MKPRSLPTGYTIHVYCDYDVGFIARRWTWETVRQTSVLHPYFLTMGRAFTKSGARRAAIRAARINQRRNP